MTTLHTHIYILADSLWSDVMTPRYQKDVQEQLDGKIKEWMGIVKTEITRKRIVVSFIGELTDDAEVREWMDQVMRGASHWWGVFPSLGRAEPVVAQHQAKPRELDEHELHKLRHELLRDAQLLVAGTSLHVPPDEALRRSVWLLTLVISTLM